MQLIFLNHQWTRETRRIHLKKYLYSPSFWEVVSFTMLLVRSDDKSYFCWLYMSLIPAYLLLVQNQMGIDFDCSSLTLLLLKDTNREKRKLPMLFSMVLSLILQICYNRILLQSLLASNLMKQQRRK